MKQITVVFSTNNKFAYGLLIAIYSLLENNKKHNLIICVLHSNLSKHNLDKLQELQAHYKNSLVRPIQVADSRFKDLPLMAWYSVETYYRYILADILPKTDVVLYIDVDTLIVGDIYDLYKTDLSGYYIAGVNPEWKVDNSLYSDHMKNLGIGGDDLYINAGVTLMNLEKIRKDNMVTKLFENTKKYKQHIKMVDQDVINITFKGSIQELDPKYNFRMPAMIQSPEKLDGAKILHFTESTKPWDGNRYEARAFFGLWYQYEYGYNKLVGTIDKKPYKNRYDNAHQSLVHERDTLARQTDLLAQKRVDLQRAPLRSAPLNKFVNSVVKRIKSLARR